ncbi:MAG: DNA-3-methyladenine glycosylase 2 family protein [Planctomycetes bacterium]|nr:DNA-3-methyladenine glycosylase 2 family protein [Planctomycetota bacterium]MBI3846717.1 DNA-3-methyladenine glycosylase 2 family protein [Planctomycetota bacterium]
MSEIALRVRGPLDVAATLARYRRFGDDPTNAFAGDSLVRALRVEGEVVPYEVRWSGPVDDVRLAARVSGRARARVVDAVTADVERVFGLGFDIDGFYAMAKRDRVLSPLVRRHHGFRPTLGSSALESLVGAIVAQQVNLTFAFRLRERLVRRWGTEASFARSRVFAFPEPSTIARALLAELRAMHYSQRKAEYVIEVARALASGSLEAAALAASDDATVIERLTAIRGIGRWSADWYLARHLGRGAVCPAGDLAVRKAFVRFCGIAPTAREDAIRKRSAAWGAHQNLAIHYLLAGLRT